MSDYSQDPFESPDEQESKLRLEDFLDSYTLADKGQRFVNYLIDYIVLAVASNGLEFVLNQIIMEVPFDSSVLLAVYSFFIVILVNIFYYAAMEMNTGKTIGKMVSRTRVVNKDGGPISWGQALGRSASRLVPFEQLSIFFSNENLCWHDTWTNTRVIRD
ncbi:MAG: RDD family protein [Bacteroidia bacterium]